MRVRPVRFTDDVPAMRRFLEALGLRADLTDDRGNWLELSSRTPGGAALHSAANSELGHPAGKTTLAFDTTEPLEDVRDRLHAAGYADAHVVDAAYGRTLYVTDPDGEQVAVDESMTDLYGYRKL